MEELIPPRANREGPGELDCLWIENEGLLRDEGVVFGLAHNAGALQEKEAAIRAYYRRREAEADRRRRAIEEELAVLRETRANEASSRPLAPISPTGDAPVDLDGHAMGGLVFRHAMGLAAAAVACVGTAFLVYEQLQPEFRNPGIVTAGVVGAGFFTAFLPVSLLFVGDDARRAGGVELWKVRLAEFGLPLVAAGFVVAWALDRLGPVRAVATAALLFLAFTFAGRQVLSTVPRLGSVLRAMRQERAAERQLRLEHERESANRLSGRALDDVLAALRREIAGIPSADEWEALCDAKLAIFRSEYHLAAARTGMVQATLTHPSIFATNGSR